MVGPALSESEYLSRQSAFLGQLPESSLVLIPTNPVAYRSNDTVYPYRANSYMLYLCGWSEPEAVLMAHHEASEWVTTLFVQPRDTKAELWEGRRVGVEGAALGWPVDRTCSIGKLSDYVSEFLDDCESVYYLPDLNPELDELVSRTQAVELADPTTALDDMRVIKSDAEVAMIQQSSDIASEAHIAAMRATSPGIAEWEIQSVIEAVFTARRSCWAYQSIVGGGENATILHYKSNNNRIADGDLVLVDAGCEVSGYASDITRTWPVSGKFSDQQREIYELVLKAQMAGIDACQAGSVWLSMHRATSVVLAQGLIELGILDCTVEEAIGDDIEFNGPYRNFFMHGTGHMLGLDVHDVGGGRQGDKDEGPILQPGMVVTVEPGLYFGSWRDDIEIPDRYAGIGVRIEDDVLVTADGPVVLTSGCPKTIEEIEALVGSEG